MSVCLAGCLSCLFVRTRFGSSHFGSSRFGSSHFGSSHFGSSRFCSSSTLASCVSVLHWAVLNWCRSSKLSQHFVYPQCSKANGLSCPSTTGTRVKAKEKAKGAPREKEMANLRLPLPCSHLLCPMGLPAVATGVGNHITTPPKPFVVCVGAPSRQL